MHTFGFAKDKQHTGERVELDIGRQYQVQRETIARSKRRRFRRSNDSFVRAQGKKKEPMNAFVNVEIYAF
jgi:hypothetical protein